MNKVILALSFCLLSLLSIGSMAQTKINGADETQTVVASGEGLSRDQAVQSALRNAVAQAAGVAVQSETKMENFVTISDAVATRAQGYVTKYDVVSEKKLVDATAITVRATVSMAPLKADASLLAKSLGGVRFLVLYDERNHSAEENELLDYATERVNQYLSKRKYRYVEKRRTERLKTEASNLMQENRNSELGYAQQLALMADAQFIIYIKNIVVESREEAFGTRTRSKVGLEIKAYDNCTGEGLGTVVINGPEMVSAADASSRRTSIDMAVDQEGDKLLSVILEYIGGWVNNGTPFELRFYNGGGFRELRTLRNNLKSDASFGGEMEVTAADDYQKLNCTFKKKPDELADKVLDVADALPEWKSRQLDVKYIYGRQICFAPRTAKVPVVGPLDDSGKPVTPVIQHNQPAPQVMKAPTPTVRKATPSRKPAPRRK